MNEPRDEIADLVRAAGRRPELSPEAFQRMRAATHAQWQVELRSRRRRRVLAIAAGVAALGLVAILFSLIEIPGKPALVAHVAETADHQFLDAGDEFHAPAARGVTLTRLPDTSTSLRLAANTHLRWQSTGQVELLAGAIYVDSRRAAPGVAPPAGEPLVIVAGNARIEHLGTQFMVVRRDQDVQVSVRDGLVLVTLGNESRSLERGETATLLVATGTIRPGRMDGSNSDWEWVEALAPSLAIEGRDLLSVLKALAHECGVEIRFANPGVEAMARATTLHGPALDLPPREAMRALLTSSGLRMSAGTNASVMIDLP
jgi:ferric-dicitrate binding protein FerR (iron transport regulator)